jgi:hypothetical protein
MTAGNRIVGNLDINAYPWCDEVSAFGGTPYPSYGTNLVEDLIVQ